MSRNGYRGTHHITNDIMNYFYLYILQCSDNSYYVGHTDNIEKRVAEHNSNQYQCYTSTRLPIKVVFTQQFTSRDEVIIAEQRIKNWSRQKKEALISNNWEQVSLLAKKKFKKNI